MQILLSTSNERIFQISKLVNSIDFEFCELLIGHQCNIELSEEAIKFLESLKLNKKIKYFQLHTSGVAKSRNFLINKSDADFIVFCDDDIEYIPGSLKNIKNIMIRERLDVLTGVTLTTKNKPIKNYKNKNSIHNKLSILKVGTVEVVVRRASLHEAIRFPEDMGAGEYYPICDEPVFLSRCIDNSLKVNFTPIPICVHPPVSSGMNTSSVHTQSRGLCFRRVFGWAGIFLLIPFSLKMKLKNRRLKFFIFLKDIISGFYADK